jgi:hypothetical protein
MFHSTLNQVHERVTVRHAHSGDEAALHNLAVLDSADAPAGPMLVAESEGRILAALPLADGRAIADPFIPTAALLDLLELRRRQLEREHGGVSHRLASRVRGLVRQRVAA